MAWVQRTEDGKITAVYGAQQPYALEELPDDTPEVVEYLSSPLPLSPKTLDFTEEALTAGFKAIGFNDADIAAFFKAARA